MSVNKTYIKSNLTQALIVRYLINPLMPNGLYSGPALSPLNNRMTIKVAANRVSVFGGILLTPIQFSAVVCCASGLWKVMLCFRTQNVPPPPPKPPHKHRCRHRIGNCAFFFQLTSTVLTVGALITTHSRVCCGLKYRHWPMKQTLFS
jgi:hypothetical protein